MCSHVHTTARPLYFSVAAAMLGPNGQKPNGQMSSCPTMAAPFAKLLYLYVGTSDFDRDLKYYTDVWGARGGSVSAAFDRKDAAALGKLIAEDAVCNVSGSRPDSGDRRGRGDIIGYCQKLSDLTEETFHGELIDVLASGMHAAALAAAK